MTKATTFVEQDLSTYDLRALLWGYDHSFKSIVALSPLTRDALTIWYRRKLTYALSSEPSPLTPLFDNPKLPEGHSINSIDNYYRELWPTARQFVDPTLGTFASALPDTTSKVTWLTRRHLSEYCKQLHDSSLIHRPLTGFEQLCILAETPRHPLSLIHKQILEHIHGVLPIYTTKWSAEVGIDISEADWSKAFLFTSKTSISSYMQEKNYKVLSRWYRVPTTLRMMFPANSDTCWRCNSKKGTYLHIWWECDRLLPFWTQIFHIYSEIYDKPLMPSPTIALLSILPGAVKSQKNSLLKFFMSAGRQLIPRHWKSTTLPSILEWVNEINNIMLMEEMQANVLDKQAKFSYIWSVWRHYSTSDKLKQRLKNTNPP